MKPVQGGSQPFQSDGDKKTPADQVSSITSRFANKFFSSLSSISLRASSASPNRADNHELRSSISDSSESSDVTRDPSDDEEMIFLEVSKWEDYMGEQFELKKEAKSRRPISELIGQFINYLQKNHMTGGTVQKRLQRHLMRGISDSLLVKRSGSSMPGLDLKEKIEELVNTFPKFQDESSDFALQGAKMKAIFEEFGKGSTPENILRFEMFNVLDQVYHAPEYQSYLSSGKKLSELNSIGCPEHVVAEIEFFQDVAYSMFTGPKLHQFADEAVHAALASGAKNASVEENPHLERLQEQLKLDAERIVEADEEIKGGSLQNTANKLSGHFNVQFRPLAFNNYMQDLFDLKIGEQTCRFLRFGTPTREIDGEEAAIEPVLFLFLDKMIENGESILSVQLQNLGTSKAAVGGEEKQRVQLMVDLAKHPRYSQAIKVLALPEDSDFYHQKGNYIHRDNSHDFKGMLYQQITQGRDDLYVLPITDAEERAYAGAEINHLINQIHEIFYDGKESLSQSERHTFQKILYAHLTLYFIHAKGVDNAHVQCKDAMDRAMSLVVLLYYQGLIQTGEDADPERLRELQVLTQEAALFIKGQAMHGKRFETFMACMDQIESLSSEKRKELKQMTLKVKDQEVKMEDLLVKSDPKLSYTTAPSEAKNIDEYKQLLRQEKGHTVRLPRLEKLASSDPDRQLKRDIKGNIFYLINGKPVSLELDLDDALEHQIAQLLQKGYDPVVFSKHVESLSVTADKKTAILGGVRDKIYSQLAALTTVDERRDLGQQILVDVQSLMDDRYSDMGRLKIKAMAQPSSICSTVINLVEKDVQPVAVEAYQHFSLINIEDGSTLGYIEARLHLDLATRRVQIEILPPSSTPQSDFSLFSGGSTASYHFG